MLMRSTMEVISYLDIYRKNIEKPMKISMWFFIDLEKVYDEMHKEVMWWILENKLFPLKVY